MARGSGRYSFYHWKYSFKYLVPLGTGDTPGKVQNVVGRPETGPFDGEGGGGMGPQLPRFGEAVEAS